MISYTDLARRKIDLSPLGLKKGDTRSNYFCTPKGTAILGWEGADGIHYCTIKAFGEMVFAVNPMGLQNDNVHPLAQNFEDFLRLLLACGHTGAIEQAHSWEQPQFDIFLSENPITPEQQKVLTQLLDKFPLTPMEHPFSYIKVIQSSFDYSKIPYRKDYYEWVPKEPKCPEWKVYYQGSFFGRGTERSRPGQELSVGKQIVWEDENVHIPAVYLCSAGLVIDFCVEVAPERVKAFLEKSAHLEYDGCSLSQEDRERVKLENPLMFDLDVVLTLNGKKLQQKQTSGTCWIPPACLPESMQPEFQPELTSKWVLEHYGLDESKGWMLWRKSFQWATKNKPKLKELVITLIEDPKPVPGMHFKVHKPGEQVEFTHLVTGTEHKLTVLEYESQEFDMSQMPSDREYPTHYVAMSYTVEPDLPPHAFSIHDCIDGDRPRKRTVDPTQPEATDHVTFCIIGGADGPTTLSFTGAKSKTRTAVSSLHFEAMQDVEWRMSFCTKTRKDITLKLVP